MTKKEIVNFAAHETGMQAKECVAVVEAALQGVKESLARGESVFVRGFGTLNVRTVKAKIGQDICKGRSIEIPARQVVKFKPCKELADSVNPKNE